MTARSADDEPGTPRAGGRRVAGLVLLFLLSLALRGAFLAGIEPRETLRADAWHYTMLAWSLANRGTYSDSIRPPLVPHMRWPPGYPMLLAPFYRGRDVLTGTATVLPVQVVADAAIPVLTALLATGIVPGSLVWIPGLLAAACPLLVTTPSFPVSETAFTLLLLALLLALRRLVARPGTGIASVAGSIGALLALVRTSGLGLVGLAAAWLALRQPAPGARRAAGIVLALAVLPAVTWELRSRSAAPRGVPPPSYFAQAVAQGIYPDLVYADSPRGYAMEADPEFPGFSPSLGRTLATAWARARADPWPALRWNLLDRWLALWEFGMIQSPPITIYPVVRGLVRPAAIEPGVHADEPLAALYWIFRALWYWCVVPAVGLGALLAMRRRVDTGPAARLRELAYVLIAGHVLLHGILIPEPRFLVPLRPLLFVLAVAALADLAARVSRHATAAVVALVVVIAITAWTAAVVAARQAPAARVAAAASLADGRRLEAAGDVAGALAAYDAARAQDPGNVEAAMLAGLLLHHRLGDPAHAVMRYRVVLALHPDHYGARHQLATALLAAGRTAEARAAWASFARAANAVGDRATLERAPAALRGVSPPRP